MRVAVRILTNGDMEFYADEDVDFLVVDESAPRDRVFQIREALNVGPEKIDKLLGDSRIGQPGDMPVTEARIRAILNGEEPPKGPDLKEV